MNVGFIGLGHMGVPMSGRILAAGHDLIVHDLRREAAAGLLAAGARWAPSPRQAGAGRDVVITMLPAPREVEEVLLGRRGLLGGLPPGAVWIDMSTSVPAVADRVRAVAEAREIAVLDAPVSGMAAGAGPARCKSSSAAAPRPTSGSGPCSRSWGSRSGSCVWGRTVPATPSSS